MGRDKLHDNRKLGSPDWTLIGGIILIVAGYILLHDLIGGTLLEHNIWDSYTLQALAWRRGEFALGQNYTWLELAVFNGDYYVSFPPVPSLVLLPFTFYFGEETPNNFIIMIVTILSVVFCYLCFKRNACKSGTAMFWAVFFVLGSNMLWMSTMGAVWFMAQALNLLFCIAAVYCIVIGWRGLSLALIALAVGCRPFSIFLLFAAFACFCLWEVKTGKQRPVISILRQCRYLIAPAAIGAVYLWYNYARFGNMLEFGHNYLPEFTGAGNNQFSMRYLPQNLARYFLNPVAIDKDGRLSFAAYDGFMFFIANPIFLVWFIRIGIDIYKKRFTTSKAIVCVALAANMLALLMHKSLGGWQFGARYTVDLIPCVLFYFMIDGRNRVGRLWLFIGAFAFMFNLYGALVMNFKPGYML